MVRSPPPASSTTRMGYLPGEYARIFTVSSAADMPGVYTRPVRDRSPERGSQSAVIESRAYEDAVRRSYLRRETSCQIPYPKTEELRPETPTSPYPTDYRPKNCRRS